MHQRLPLLLGGLGGGVEVRHAERCGARAGSSFGTVEHGAQLFGQAAQQLQLLRGQRHHQGVAWAATEPPPPRHGVPR